MSESDTVNVITNACRIAGMNAEKIKEEMQCLSLEI